MPAATDCMNRTEPTLPKISRSPDSFSVFEMLYKVIPER